MEKEKEREIETGMGEGERDRERQREREKERYECEKEDRSGKERKIVAQTASTAFLQKASWPGKNLQLLKLAS